MARPKGQFPGFLPKTDETRVQVLETVLERHRGKTFYVTEKLDGTSFTAFLRPGPIRHLQPESLDGRD